MSNFLSPFARSIVFALSLAVVPCATSSAARAETAAPAAPAMTKPNTKLLQTHLKEHQTYPATRAELLTTCGGCKEFSDGEKAWFAAHVPEGTYKSAAEVTKALSK